MNIFCLQGKPGGRTPGPDLTLGDPVRPPRAHDRKGPILYIFAYNYYYFGLIFFREKIHMDLSGRGLEVGKHTH
jgi:hypothetical protein